MPEHIGRTASDLPDGGDEGESYGRPFWTGTVSFGLVNVPVGLFPASRSNPTALRMVSQGGTPLHRRFYTARDDRELSRDDIVRGYEVEKDRFVVLDDDELERLAPEKTGDVDLRVFVKRSEIDPMYFERGYYLVPVGANTKAYRLLARVMEDMELAGIATFVMRGKEYLVAIMAENGILRAETLRFADELRTPERIGLPKPARVPDADLKRVEREIARLTESELDENELVDHPAVKLLDLVEKKLKKDKDVLELPEEQEEEEATGADVIDLRKALERSLRKGAAAKRSTRRKRSTAKRG
ncbi:MAG TPA: Ku protein [Gemmatimonadaceae bacterium]|nr:Ku protein [Gemmatimonadaceae bacterium]